MIRSVVVVVGLTSPSVSFTVDEMLSVKFVSLAGVIVRPDNVHPDTSMDVFPIAAVNVWPCPSFSFAPIGMLLITRDATTSALSSLLVLT